MGTARFDFGLVFLSVRFFKFFCLPLITSVIPASLLLLQEVGT